MPEGVKYLSITSIHPLTISASGEKRLWDRVCIPANRREITRNGETESLWLGADRAHPIRMDALLPSHREGSFIRAIALPTARHSAAFLYLLVFVFQKYCHSICSTLFRAIIFSKCDHRYMSLKNIANFCFMSYFFRNKWPFLQRFRSNFVFVLTMLLLFCIRWHC